MVAPIPSSAKVVEQAADEQVLKLLAGLSDKKRAAIEALTVGFTVAGAAEKVGVHRGTVSRWLLEDAEFNAALNALKMEAIRHGHHRLISLIPTCLMAIENAINGGNVRIAMQILQHTLFAKQPMTATISPERVACEMHIAELQQQTALHQQQTNLQEQSEETIERAKRVARDRDSRLHQEVRQRRQAEEIVEEERRIAEKKRRAAETRANQQLQKPAAGQKSKPASQPALAMPPASVSMVAATAAPIATTLPGATAWPSSKNPGQIAAPATHSTTQDLISAAARSAAEALSKSSNQPKPKNAAK